jgi:hypothetical protein
MHKVIVVLLLVAGTAAAQSRDTQLWGEAQLSIPLHNRVDLVVSGMLRIGRDVTHLVYERAGAGVSFKLSKYLSVSPIYYYVAAQPIAGRSSTESRFWIDGTLKLQLWRLTISDRNAIEHRFRQGQDTTRYRNRLHLELPIKIGGWKPFASDEIFYDFSLGNWSRNRLSIGMSRSLGNGFSIDLYYLMQNDSHSRPGDLQVFGSALKVKL